jgi:hypothetical protein
VRQNGRKETKPIKETWKRSELNLFQDVDFNQCLRLCVNLFVCIRIPERKIHVLTFIRIINIYNGKF